MKKEGGRTVRRGYSEGKECWTVTLNVERLPSTDSWNWWSTPCRNRNSTCHLPIPRSTRWRRHSCNLLNVPGMRRTPESNPFHPCSPLKFALFSIFFHHLDS